MPNPNNEWAVQRRAGAAQSRMNNVIYIGRASFRMEPSPVLNVELGATPAPQVELLDTGHGSGPAGSVYPALGVPITAGSSDEGEAPYLRQRISTDPGGILTPTPMIDLTDLAVVMPTPPPIASPDSSPVLELRTLPALDPADETGVTPVPTVLRRSRVTLSRPRLAGLGVLAFSAGLLTAATAGVLARPARTVAAATSAPAASATVTAATTTAASPTGPVLAAAEATAPAAPVTALPEERANLEPAPSAPVADATPVAVTAPAAKTAASTTGKARGKGTAPVRGRSHTPNRSRSGTHVDSGVGQAELAAPATEAASDEANEAPAPVAAPSKRAKGPNWVDPFAE